MTCLHCGGVGYTSAPYMWPDLFTITLHLRCGEADGRRMLNVSTAMEGLPPLSAQSRCPRATRWRN